MTSAHSNPNPHYRSPLNPPSFTPIPSPTIVHPYTHHRSPPSPPSFIPTHTPHTVIMATKYYIARQFDPMLPFACACVIIFRSETAILLAPMVLFAVFNHRYPLHRAVGLSFTLALLFIGLCSQNPLLTLYICVYVCRV